MKKISCLLVLISTTIHAQVVPNLDEGEVKISYPCETLNIIPRKKEEKVDITFYDRKDLYLYNRGIILRKRVSEKESDFTIKYRGNLLLGENEYDYLSSVQHGKFKCEFDMTYGPVAPRSVSSCSFKADGTELMNEHLVLVDMVKAPIHEWNGSLIGLKEFKAKARTWKMKLSDDQEMLSPFKKKPDVQMWTFRNECMLEVSGKVDSLSKAQDGFNFLLSLIDAAPSEVQGNKTGSVLKE